MSSYEKQILRFIEQLRISTKLPDQIDVLYPFEDPQVKKICRQFYHKFYNDHQQRNLIIGINPGRFGAGVTGIPFTDPIRLQEKCEIENPWQKKQELSSVFVYDMIAAYGGVEKFYSHFYITAVSPIGFTKGNKNINYYDDKQLEAVLKPFIVKCMKSQLAFGINKDKAFCLGDGKNFRYLSKLNQEYQFFDKIIPLSHPRFIMQYKLKTKADYIKRYLDAFNNT